MAGGKMARFADVVAKGGAPEPHVLWGPVARDAEFQRALKAHRVVTVHQDNVGAKKDYGLVGYHEEPHAEYLVFPRSLRGFEGRRIVGINYDLLAKGGGSGKPPAGRGGRSARTPSATPAKPKLPPERPSEPPAAEPPAPAAKVSPVRRPAARNQQSPAKTTTLPAAEMPAMVRMRREVAKAVKELKAGRSVAAYERLQALLRSVEA